MSDGDGVNRRTYLALASGFSATTLSGCLRFSEASTETPPGGTTTPGEETDEPTERAGGAPGGGENTYDVDRFTLESLWSDGMMRRTDTLSVSTGSGGDDVDGSWTGNDEMFDEQACARYSFELLEGDEVIARTGERVLIVGYDYEMDQTEEAVFVTYQPSVNEDWDVQLLLQDGDREHALSPNVHSSRDVVEFDLTALDAESGEYEWVLEITPVSDGTPTGFTTLVGTFNNMPVYVPPYPDGFYSSRNEAIATAASHSQSSATSVGPPQTWESDGLEIVESLHHGGSSNGRQHLSRDFYIGCDSSFRFGSDVDRRFRATNLTLGTSNVFEPE